MRLMLSGEGPTDLGVGGGGLPLQPGPMAWVVDKLLERHHCRYSLLQMHAAGSDCVSVVHKSQLVMGAKNPAAMLLPGVKFGQETGFFTRNAQVLGQLAGQSKAATGVPVIAVLFRDGDGTRSVPAKEWAQKVASMERGFELAGCPTGVPMVPRPKSEAWLLCGLKAQPYQQCAGLEDAPGNDGSPNSLKSRLAALNGGTEPSAQAQAQWVENDVVDALQISMPSYDHFKNHLHRAAHAAGLPMFP